MPAEKVENVGCSVVVQLKGRLLARRFVGEALQALQVGACQLCDIFASHLARQMERAFRLDGLGPNWDARRGAASSSAQLLASRAPIRPASESAPMKRTRAAVPEAVPSAAIAPRNSGRCRRITRLPRRWRRGGHRAIVEMTRRPP